MKAEILEFKIASRWFCFGILDKDGNVNKDKRSISKISLSVSLYISSRF
jgi:hypothetical protein